MALPRITSLLERCTTSKPPFPPTDLFNEGWLLRLILDWYAQNRLSGSPLYFAPEATWFSEARLPSVFLARYQKDPLAESWTHADGVIGHFEIDQGKSGCSLRVDASQFVVTEAKIFSKLSAGVKNAPYFDQAARNVACIAELLSRAGRSPENFDYLGFYVTAPQSQIDTGMFSSSLTKTSLEGKVQQRVSAYAGSKDEWFNQWFKPLLAKINVKAISWESLLAPIAETDAVSYGELHTFYSNCLQYNQASP